MRWSVEILPLGASEIQPVSLCLEAPHWQQALREARRSLGHSDSLENLSLNILEDGADVVAPMERCRLVLRRAPANAPLKPLMTQSVQAALRPRGSIPSPTPAPAAARPKPVSAQPVPVRPAPKTHFQVVVERLVPPSKASPLTYREYAYAIREGSSELEAERFVLERLEAIQRELADVDTAKLINLAVFDHVFEGKPLRPPLVTLAWKDWKEEPPEIRYTSRPGVSMPPPCLEPRISMPPSGPSAPPRPSTPPRPIAPPRPSAPPVSFGATRDPYSSRSARPSFQGPESARRTPPPPSSVTGLASERKGDPLAQTARQRPTPKAPTARAADPVARTMASVRPYDAGRPSQPSQPPRPSRTPDPPAMASRQRLSCSEELSRPSDGPEDLSDLQEVLGDLHFLRTASEGASFVAGLAMERMRCSMAFAQLYDADQREFVVLHAVGPNAADAVGFRTQDRDALLSDAKRRSRAIMINGKDPRVRKGRWAILGGAPRSILVCSAMHDEKLFGLLEVAHTAIDAAFRKADENALACMAQAFGAFLAKLGPDGVREAMPIKR